ncbi:LysM peptidoglycan-binding domain-containing protein [Paenibacillus sp. HJGM_3]|uniref:LysM peptidoglycan-binding domain-containing protein n=1 Tax=Paenibacillus sp. HJGM_3 TaxID=3379816 RepID=UPI00385DBD0C
MSQQPGLRFDIYERIVLPDEAVSIRELDGVELVPHILVDVEGEQAVVRGHLLLEGTYSSVGESRSQEVLTHLIPVEITLPLNRVSSVDEIAVQIDNFDVDLISERTLNVTGVLSLHGLEVQTSAPNEWNGEEEVVFVHTADGQERDEEPVEEEAAYAPPGAAPWLQTPAVNPARYEQANAYAPIAAVPEAPFEEPEEEVQEREAYDSGEEEEETAETVGAAEANEEVAAYEPEESENQDVVYTSAAPPAVYQPFSFQSLVSPPARQEESAPEQQSGKPREEILVDTYEDMTLLDQYETEAVLEEDANSTLWGGSSSGAAAEDAVMDADEDDDRDKSMKIAFASKKSEEAQSLDFKNYLHKQEATRKTEAETGAVQVAEQLRSPAEETGASDALEWKKLFLSETEEQKFKKVRMVIVQKEETIESIARRYDRKPQELKLYNKLQELDVSAGQVIYIP